MKGKLSLNILYCVNCNKNPITSTTFPHYCDDCVKFLKKHGRFPLRNPVGEQNDLIQREGVD